MKRLRDIFLFLAAFWLLLSCSEDKGRMLRQLEMLEEANRADSVMKNDSLAENLVEYFDKHGTSNERMRAKYMLGRTYYDLGELPRALETYLEAANCADTTASDCDFKVLSRIYANMGVVYEDQIQPRSFLNALIQAEHYATIAHDSVMSIECFGRRANAYSIMNKDDSVLFIKEETSRRFRDIGCHQLSALQLIMTINPLIRKGELERATHNIELYEKYSSVFDAHGEIERGREIYYYIKGRYFLSLGKTDSAELMFRKELRLASDLNNQIAGCKGLHEIYVSKNYSDSIVKYANLAYQLNDSAFLESEKRNIQKFKASYNYNYHRQEANENALKVERTNRYFIIIIAFIIIASLLVALKLMDIRKKNELKQKEYDRKINELSWAQNELLKLHKELDFSSEILKRKNEQIVELQDNLAKSLLEKEKISERQKESLLRESEIVRRLTDYVNENPPKKASPQDIHQLMNLINESFPTFYSKLNAKDKLSELEYEVCMLIRVGFSPSAICKLTGITDGYVANIRKRLLKKVFGVDQGQPKDFDKQVLSIR